MGESGFTVVPVVGIGASAGGLDVFERLLRDLPRDTGFAFVLVQHLDPAGGNMLAGILARATAMPVAEAADGARVEPNCVYVIPASLDVTIEAGRLKLEARPESPAAHLPIDRFLRSLAADCGGRAIGIVLSGTGADGAAGVEAIRGAGGVTIAQESASARFPEMPEAAVSTACVDLVLPIGEIAAELVRIGRHPYLAAGNEAPADAAAPAPDEKQFPRILALLRDRTGIDFSQYREKMVRRRIRRRLALRNFKDLAEYYLFLRSDEAELAALNRDLLICVTSFFRDPEAFEALKRVALPAILRGRGANDPVRVWVAGCATGEEAFSIAICIREYLRDGSEPRSSAGLPVQVFASDVSAAAIERARAGVYPESIAADVSEERLNRFFVKTPGGYRVAKEIREMCVFAKHNLIADPPFSKLDLIACRNVLIYLNGVQENTVPLFHYALKPGGFLMFGASEAAPSPDLFTPADPERGIFVRRETTSRLPRPRISSPHAAPLPDFPADEVSAAPPPGSVASPSEVDKILRSRYAPAGVVVDEDLQAIEFLGHASTYLTLSAGKTSLNLIKLIADTGLFLEVEKLVRQALISGRLERKETAVYRDGDPSAGARDGLNLLAIPVPAAHGHSVMVLFEPAPPRPAEAPAAVDSRDLRIELLKEQLAEAKERFLSTNEDRHALKEESENTNREALSANEELRSLNEELETAREELQSTNEEIRSTNAELVAVNAELQAGNAALAEARDFAVAIVDAVRQPLLVLDSDLKVRMANRALCAAFGLEAEAARGQSVFSLSKGAWDVPALRGALEACNKSGQALPDLEVICDFPGIGRRDLAIGGRRLDRPGLLLLAVEDVTDRKLEQQARLRTEESRRQSQKLEAVGRLAGGVAHDFNNLLTIIIGYGGLLWEQLEGNEPARATVAEMANAANRAASVTQQLLAFSRKQVLQPKVLNLNSIVADFGKMLQQIAGERIEVRTNCATGLWQVRADPGELGRAIVNLALNARDAMPAGGVLTIETSNVVLGSDDGGLGIEDSVQAGLPPGRYAAMVVRDSGTGIDPESMTHVFEPFFTTKEMGSGSGLGLATVLGIVEQSGGGIRCYSQPGRGTTFRILLPALPDQPVVREAPPLAAAAARGGSETILLVEDESALRGLARLVLEARGYSVLEAADGREGLAVFTLHSGAIDLLLTDVVMPISGGRELAEAARRLRPGLKVLFMSGHTEDTILKEGIGNGAQFLQKPFTSAVLALRVRDALDSASRSTVA